MNIQKRSFKHTLHPNTTPSTFFVETHCGWLQKGARTWHAGGGGVTQRGKMVAAPHSSSHFCQQQYFQLFLSLQTHARTRMWAQTHAQAQAHMHRTHVYQLTAPLMLCTEINTTSFHPPPSPPITSHGTHTMQFNTSPTFLTSHPPHCHLFASVLFSS